MKHFLRTITAKEANYIFRQSISTAKRKLQQVREHFNKPPRSKVTVQEFCEVFRYKPQDVLEVLKSHGDGH